MSKLTKNEDAFTGLEAAIVLIAFVVVAAVFSYVVLGAGFFTTQKSQEVVHTGVGQASSALEVSGPVVVQAKDTTALNTISFYLQLASGGTSVDLSKVTYTVSTSKNVMTWVDEKSEDPAITTKVARVYVGATQKGTTTDNMLDKGDMVLITITVDGKLTIGKNTKFLVEVKPDVGAALPISRTAPPSLEANKFYEVY